MTKLPLFRPSDTLLFRSLPEEFLAIMQMRRVFDRFKDLGYCDEDAFYHGYCQTHPNKHGFATALGAQPFMRTMHRLLGVAQEHVIEDLIKSHFWVFHNQLAFHNTIANTLDPVRLLRIATSPPPVHADRLTRQYHFEAWRQLAIALQLFSIESVDPDPWVADDLAHIDTLSEERLFEHGASKDLWVLSKLTGNGESGMHCIAQRIFTSSRKKDRTRRKWLRHGPVRVDRLLCRATRIGSSVFYTFVVNRRKRLASTLMKLERGRSLRDRRGWKYVVVAVANGHSLRVATERDLDVFTRHTYDTLWNHPLVMETDTSTPNPDSSSRYRDAKLDRKVVGRYEREDKGRVVAGSVEQITISIEGHINTLVATDDLNHAIYAFGKMRRHIAPLWFPNRRGPFDHIHQFRLPGYGIDWERAEVREALDRWCLTRLQG